MLTLWALPLIFFFFFFFFFLGGGGLRLYVPGNNVSVMPGRNHRLLGITSTFWEVNVSCFYSEKDSVV